jgi:hypothetical protein
MLKRHEVEILLKAGHRKTEVARLTGVSLCSVKRIAQEGPVVHVDDAAERAQRQVGRPSTACMTSIKPFGASINNRCGNSHRVEESCGKNPIKHGARGVWKAEHDRLRSLIGISLASAHR